MGKASFYKKTMELFMMANGNKIKNKAKESLSFQIKSIMTALL